MKKIVLIILFLTTSIICRENPFSPQQKLPEPIFELPKLVIEKKPVEVKVLKEVEIKELPQPKIEKAPVIIKPEPIKVKKVVIKPKTVKKKTKTITKKHKIRKIHKKSSKPKLIYSGTFAKVKAYKSSIKIITKDKMIQHLKLIKPNRLVFDLERFDVVPPFSKKVRSRYIKQIKVGHHDYFYRITLNLRKEYKHYTLTKKPYGYIIKLSSQ
jgi:hypothetical protein